MMRRVLRTLGIGVAVALIAGACSGDDGSDTTTTSSGAPTDGETTLTTSASVGDDGENGSGQDESGTTTSVPSTTTTLAAFSVPAFTIVKRTPADEGDTVIVLLDTESYESLTDIDLQNVLSEVVDEFPPVYEAHVIDSAEVIDFVNAADLDDEAQQLLNVHYLVRLEEGFRIRYLGQFEANGVSILGS